VIETGIGLEIVRKGKRLLLHPAEPNSKLSHLKKRPDYIVGEPEDLVHLDWSEGQRP